MISSQAMTNYGYSDEITPDPITRPRTGATRPGTSGASRPQTGAGLRPQIGAGQGNNTDTAQPGSAINRPPTTRPGGSLVEPNASILSHGIKPVDIGEL